jgi:hypothetical protein
MSLEASLFKPTRSCRTRPDYSWRERERPNLRRYSSQSCTQDSLPIGLLLLLYGVPCIASFVCWSKRQFAWRAKGISSGRDSLSVLLSSRKKPLILTEQKASLSLSLSFSFTPKPNYNPHDGLRRLDLREDLKAETAVVSLYRWKTASFFPIFDARRKREKWCRIPWTKKGWGENKSDMESISRWVTHVMFVCKQKETKETLLFHWHSGHSLMALKDTRRTRVLQVLCQTREEKWSIETQLQAFLSILVCFRLKKSDNNLKTMSPRHALQVKSRGRKGTKVTVLLFSCRGWCFCLLHTLVSYLKWWQKCQLKSSFSPSSHHPWKFSNVISNEECNLRTLFCLDD